MTELTDELASIAATLRRSTVQVRSGNDGVGSGVIWHSDGIIITNAHVVRGLLATVELWDGRVLEAAIIAKDTGRDLAAIKVNEKNLLAANIGNSDIRVGELVLAVGNPLGVVGALTTGIIHAVGMTVGTGFTNNHTDNLTEPAQSTNLNQKYPNWIQADIRLFPGNSGGPLADARGRVIGINTMIVNGLALAIPSHGVESFLQQKMEAA